MCVCVCVRVCLCKRDSQRVYLLMYLHVYKVAIACEIPHVCMRLWCVYAGKAISPRSREAGGAVG